MNTLFVTDDFATAIAAIGGEWIPDGGHVTIGVDVPTFDEVHAAACTALGDLRIAHQSKSLAARCLKLDDGREFMRRKCYVMAEPTREGAFNAARAIARYIHGKWGEGRCWTAGTIGYLQKRGDDAGALSTCSVGIDDWNIDVPARTFFEPDAGKRIRMGCYYVHDGMPALGGVSP